MITATAETPGASGTGVPYHLFALGWYQVMWSHELDVGDVRAVHYFDRDLVVFRNESGRVAVLDAVCPHLGAHLAHGGCVQGDDIACPFHGWTWNAEGHNTDIPYAKRPNLVARIGSYPVREVNGGVFMWFHHDGDEPTWEPPRLDQFYDSDFFPLHPHGTTHLWRNVKVTPQFVIENSADFAHFKYVHKNAEIAEIDYFRPGHPALYYKMITKYLTPHAGVVEGTLPAEIWGLGFLVFHVLGVHDTSQIVAVTPIDAHHSDMRISVVARNTDGTPEPEGMALRVMRHQIKEIERDLPIWENMVYQNRPLLTPEEAKGFRLLRDWTRQFYPGGTPVQLEQIERKPRVDPEAAAS